MAIEDGGYTDLHSAAQDGDLASVRDLLNQDCNLNQFDECGNTPLLYASQGGHHDVMKLLITTGADVNAHDEKTISDTALAYIAGNCSLETAAILVEAGADPRIRGWMQLNALHRSGERKRGDGPAVHKLLLKAAEQLGEFG